MDNFDRAIIFATEAHSGQMRKLRGVPYILHPMEVAGIIGTMTTNREVMAAGLLHDTIEDCGISVEKLREEFGDYVVELVCSETEYKYPDLPRDVSWKRRKEESLELLKNSTDINVHILWLADKLANARSFYRVWLTKGDELWTYMNMKDPAMHAWYYREVRELTRPYLIDFIAYKEYCEIVSRLFNDNI